MNERNLIRPLRVRFTQPEDIARYGDGWYVYDERNIVRRPARDLVELEAELGMPLPTAMNEMRASSVLGDLAGTWIAVRDSDPKLAGPFDEFSPLVMLCEWETVPADEPGKDQGTPPSGEQLTFPLQNDLTDTVVLQTLPAVEWIP